MKRIAILLICILISLPSIFALSEKPEFKFTHYNTAIGLPSNCIRDILQDPDGFIWFATDGGLVRFDGFNTKVILPPIADSTGSSDLYAMSLCLKEGEIIAAMARNIYRFDKRSESLQPVNLLYPDGIPSVKGGEVRKIICTKDGQLWASVEGRGIYEVARNLSVKKLHLFPELNNCMSTLFEDSHGNLWGVSIYKEGGVYIYDKKKGEFKKFYLDLNGERVSPQAQSVFEDENGEMWLGSWTKGLIHFDPASRKGVAVDGGNFHKLYHIHSIEQYSPARLLVGSEQGLTLFDIPSSTSCTYAPDELDRRSLSNQFVYPILKDKEGGVWVGTFYGGVNYMAPDTKHIRSLTHSKFRNSICGDVISCIDEAPDGSIWIGSDDGGLCRYEPTTGNFRSYPLNGGSEGNNVHALDATAEGIWVGTYSDGAGLLNPATGVWKRIPLEGVGNNYNCYSIFRDTHGTVWMAAGNTLNRLDENRGMFVRHRDLGAWIVNVVQDSHLNLWIATQGKGVFFYNPYFDTWANYTTSRNHGSLPHNHVNQIKISEEGKIYAATSNGIAVFNEKDHSFHKIEMELPSRQATIVEPDGQSLWIATMAGLTRLWNDGKREQFTGLDGLPSNAFSAGASIRGSDGRIYFGTTKGICIISPDDIKYNTVVPPIRFTGLDIINESVNVGDETLPESLNTIRKLTLRRDQHTFTIYFAALSYAHPWYNSYRYKLEGFDKDWIQGNNINRATYSNLPPGKYKFRVIASNNDGTWNNEGVSLDIEILPEWYATWWMKTIYILAAIFLGLFIVRYDMRRREKAYREELARMADNKEKEVYRTKLNFFTIVAHEIRTPVSLIIGPLEKVMEAAKDFPKASRSDLSMINSNAKRLLSLVNQMLDFKKVEESALPTVFNRVALRPLLESVAERFRPSIEHKGATLLANYPSPDMEVDICPESFTKLVSNLLNNARKFTKDRVLLSCIAREADGKFVIVVEDNGIGISKDNIAKIFTPFYQIINNPNESRGGTGLGLSIVKSVAESHGGSVEVESEPGKGSKFIVTLPIRQNAVAPLVNARPENMPEGDVKVAVKIPQGDKKPLMLVVDDNVEMLSYISKSMEDIFEVMTAENGREALDILHSRTVDMIVCDWMMPVMDGLTLLRHVRNESDLSHIPFVMLTAKTDNSSKVESMRIGADAYVEKPFSMSFLKARVENLVSMRRRLMEKYAANPLEPVTTLATTPVEDEFLKRMTAIIEENFSNPNLTVDFLADAMGISRTGLYAKIRSLAGVKPNELIKITRLKKAAELLAAGGHTVNEICYMTGFSGASYFSKCFQQQFGVRPNQFANSVDERRVN